MNTTDDVSIETITVEPVPITVPNDPVINQSVEPNQEIPLKDLKGLEDQHSQMIMIIYIRVISVWTKPIILILLLKQHLVQIVTIV